MGGYCVVNNLTSFQVTTSYGTSLQPKVTWQYPPPPHTHTPTHPQYHMRRRTCALSEQGLASGCRPTRHRRNRSFDSSAGRAPTQVWVCAVGAISICPPVAVGQFVCTAIARPPPPPPGATASVPDLDAHASGVAGVHAASATAGHSRAGYCATHMASEWTCPARARRPARPRGHAYRIAIPGNAGGRLLATGVRCGTRRYGLHSRVARRPASADSTGDLRAGDAARGSCRPLAERMLSEEGRSDLTLRPPLQGAGLPSDTLAIPCGSWRSRISRDHVCEIDLVGMGLEPGLARDAGRTWGRIMPSLPRLAGQSVTVVLI